MMRTRTEKKIIAIVAVVSGLYLFACEEGEQLPVWSVVSVPEYGKPSLFAVDARPASAAWAVGEKGTLKKYESYLWEDYEMDLTDKAIYDLDVSSSVNGWAVGAAGTLLRYVDGGWYAVVPVITKDLYGVSLYSDGTGWAVGDDGCILEFDGTEWGVYEHGLTTVALRDVVTTNVETAWAVGDAGTILFYDGGDWEALPSPTAMTLYGVAATPADNLTPPDVFICGDGGAFFELTDVTWSEIDLGTSATLRSIALYDGEEGFVVGDGNSLFALTGNGWEAVALDFFPFDEPIALKNVTLVNRSEGWAVGSSGVILRYGPATNLYGDRMKVKWTENGG